MIGMIKKTKVDKEKRVLEGIIRVVGMVKEGFFFFFFKKGEIRTEI